MVPHYTIKIYIRKEIGIVIGDNILFLEVDEIKEGLG